MNKEEARSAVMGAISMALKDPILQQGFECICKENAELKAELTKKADTNHSLVEQMADLESENAELKKLFADCDTCKRTCDIGNCCKFGSAYLPDVEKVLNEQKQLTKAKEIIKKILSFFDGEKTGVFKQAEQFLSEVEK